VPFAGATVWAVWAIAGRNDSPVHTKNRSSDFFIIPIKLP
jgi:hypothetical protein